MTLFIIVLSSKLMAQDCSYKTDSIYYINISGNLDNGRPVFMQMATKNLDSIKYYIQNQQNDFLCNILKSAIYVYEPNTGFLDMNKCLGKDAEKELISFNRQLKHFNNKCKEVISFPNNQYHFLHLSIVKTISEFWIIPFNVNQMSNISDAIQIQTDCYENQYYYKFKKIICIKALTRKEIKSIDSFYIEK